MSVLSGTSGPLSTKLTRGWRFHVSTYPWRLLRNLLNICFVRKKLRKRSIWLLKIYFQSCDVYVIDDPVNPVRSELSQD